MRALLSALFFDDDGVINSRFYGFGKLLSSFFD